MEYKKMDEFDFKLMEKFANEVKDFIADWIGRNKGELIKTKSEEGDFEVIIGGLAGALGYSVAALSLNAKRTKGQTLKLVDIAIRRAEEEAERHYDSNLNQEKK